jgi:gamma-glutamyltranspeptidase/glutathione hydrolase
MSPTFVFDASGKPLMVTGSPGGPRIINATLQSIINVVDFGMSPLDAVHATRIHHQWMPDKIYYERDSLDPDVLARLSHLGHKLDKMDSIGDVQAVVVGADGVKIGVSDSRGDGQPAVP